MKILVPVKRVIDYNVKVRVKADQTGVELANVKMAKATNQSHAIQLPGLLLEAADQQHVAIKLGQLIVANISLWRAFSCAGSCFFLCRRGHILRLQYLVGTWPKNGARRLDLQDPKLSS